MSMLEERLIYRYNVYLYIILSLLVLVCLSQNITKCLYKRLNLIKNIEKIYFLLYIIGIKFNSIKVIFNQNQ